MSQKQGNGADRARRIIGLSLMVAIAAIGISIVASLLLAPRLADGLYPFRFGWFGGIFLIFVGFWVARWLIWPWRGHYPYPRQYRMDAVSIVRERYAKGEITREQFEQMLRDLRQQGG
jgi:uncharacterized membrane protein